jgi:hypothetical protein
MSLILGLVEWDLPTWYTNHEVLNLSPDHVYFVARNYSYLQKLIQWGSRSTDKWRWSPDWYAVERILEPDKRPPRALLYHLSFIIELVRGAFQQLSQTLMTNYDGLDGGHGWLKMDIGEGQARVNYVWSIDLDVGVWGNRKLQTIKGVWELSFCRSH